MGKTELFLPDPWSTQRLRQEGCCHRVQGLASDCSYAWCWGQQQQLHLGIFRPTQDAVNQDLLFNKIPSDLCAHWSLGSVALEPRVSKYISESEKEQHPPSLPRALPQVGTQSTEGDQLGSWIFMKAGTVRTPTSNDFSHGGNHFKGLRETYTMIISEQTWDLLGGLKNKVEVWRKEGMLFCPEVLFALVLPTGPCIANGSKAVGKLSGMCS